MLVVASFTLLNQFMPSLFIAPILFFFLLFGPLASAQTGPRLFLDFPSVFLVTTDAQRLSSNVGLGSDLSMNIATHHSVLRFKGGSTFTLDPQNTDLLASLNSVPFLSMEAGVGRYRSNGNKCARTHRPAFTAIAKAGVSHFFFPPVVTADHPRSTDYYLGVELGYFYIRDIIRNSEVFASGNYYLNNNLIQVELGFRNFFNLRGRRR